MPGRASAAATAPARAARRARPRARRARVVVRRCRRRNPLAVTSPLPRPRSSSADETEVPSAERPPLPGAGDPVPHGVRSPVHPRDGPRSGPGTALDLEAPDLGAGVVAASAPAGPSAASPAARRAPHPVGLRLPPPPRRAGARPRRRRATSRQMRWERTRPGQRARAPTPSSRRRRCSPGARRYRGRRRGAPPRRRPRCAAGIWSAPAPPASCRLASSTALGAIPTPLSVTVRTTSSPSSVALNGRGCRAGRSARRCRSVRPAGG